jgi:hypothetical protein
MHRAFGPCVLAIALLAGCSKKRGADGTSKASTVTMTPSRAPTGDGGSMQTARTLGMGKSAEGKLGDGSPLWFAVFPGPMEGQVKVELKVPKDAPRSCVALAGRNAAGNVVSTLATVCSDDPTKYIEGAAKLGKDVVYLTIEPREPERAAAGAQYRVSLAAG